MLLLAEVVNVMTNCGIFFRQTLLHNLYHHETCEAQDAAKAELVGTLPQTPLGNLQRSRRPPRWISERGEEGEKGIRSGERSRREGEEL